MAELSNKNIKISVENQVATLDAACDLEAGYDSGSLFPCLTVEMQCPDRQWHASRSQLATVVT